MPLLRVTHSKDAFSLPQRDELAEAFTHCILMAEIGSDNDTARQTAYVQFIELDASAGGWYVGGEREHMPIKGGRIILEVYYPFGATNGAQKGKLHHDLAQAIGRVLDIDVTFPNRIGDWVFIHEIPEGSWGVSGQTIGVEAIHAASRGEPERIPYFKALLEASARIREQFRFPQ